MKYLNVLIVLVIGSILIGCSKHRNDDLSLFDKAELCVVEKMSVEQVHKLLGRPKNEKLGQYGAVLAYETESGRPEFWHGMNVNGVQILTKNGVAVRLYVSFAGP